ncbi:TonB-dependent receptor plug domain-containing protein [Aquabacterium parvum]|uniref:TonB-dependent receptor plug domain-containing protein n=1 Tax=Aquabacterium parvum TaxID=70584 RepID=UPI001F1FAB45|nr:TonB-dependent receptor [Aquabacterium parvum]
MSRIVPVTLAPLGAAPRAPSLNQLMRAVACMLLGQALSTPLAVQAQAQTQGQVSRPSVEEDELALSFGDKATVSIATGAQQPLRRAPAVATVITAQDIKAMGATDLTDVMETVPGVHVSRSPVAYTPLFQFRGISSDYNPQTLVLQNGVPMTTMFIGNRGLFGYGVPLENVERIEVIRGPGSALYGADAFSGVINIITKTAADIQGTEVGARGGSFNTQDAWVLHGGKLGPMDVAAHFRAGRTDGFKEQVAVDTQSYFDSLTGSSASLAPGSVNTGSKGLDAGLDLSHQNVRWRLGYVLREGETGAGVARALDPVGRGKSERIHSDVSWSGIELARDWDLGLSASYMHYTQQIPQPLMLYPPGALGGTFPNGMFGGPHTWERQLRLSAVSTYTGLDGHNLRFGVGHDDLDLYKTREFKNFNIVVTSISGTPMPLPVIRGDGSVVQVPVGESFLTPQRRKVDYAYVQDEWRFAQDWALTGGVRHDRYSDNGDTTNPRLAMVWDASVDLTAKLLYGKAFRAPALTEQYSINNPVAQGNPDLKPETIGTWEAAFAWQARPDTDVNLSLFHYRMKGIIRTTDQGTGVSVWNNAGTQHGKGMELEAVWRATSTLRLQGHYAWQRSVDEATGHDAGFAPRHHLFGRMDWSVANGWQVGGQVNRVAGRKRALGDSRPDVADYTTVDLTLRNASISKGWEFAASIRNLFYADAREPTSAGDNIPGDLPLPRRSFFLQATYSM